MFLKTIIFHGRNSITSNLSNICYENDGRFQFSSLEQNFYKISNMSRIINIGPNLRFWQPLWFFWDTQYDSWNLTINHFETIYKFQFFRWGGDALKITFQFKKQIIKTNFDRTCKLIIS